MKPKQAPFIEAVPLPNALRIYLYATAALSGAVVMIIEILGAKMLAPFFGTSHFVWTAQIAVTLVALACGYYIGGRWVDRKQSLGNLYGAMAAAALYLAFTALYRERVAYACLGLSLPAGSLLASAILFFVPLTLLAMVGPFLIRILTSSVRSVGGNAGGLTAVGTFGSFAGTVLIGYVLIPLYSNSTTLFAAAATLMALAFGYFLVWRRNGRSTALVSAVVVGVGVVGSFALQPRSWHTDKATELARRNSNFGQLQVLELHPSSVRFFLDDYLAQNIYDPGRHQSAAAFTYLLHGLARVYAPRIERVLCIGLGVGTVPMQFAGDGAKVDVVEINPAVIPLATRFFDLEPGRLRIFPGDGRYFLNRNVDRYDAIILDAFLGDSSPSHLMTREAFSAMKRALTPDGVLVMNTLGNLRPDRDFLTSSIYRTLASVFAGVRLHTDGGNYFFVASAHSDLKFLRPPELERVHPFCAQAVRDGFDNVRHPDPDRGRILTDEFNPGEFYDAANREDLRRKLAFGMKLP